MLPFKELDLPEVKDTILKWIKSCRTVEQIESLEKAVPGILSGLFGKTQSHESVSLAVSYLQGAMDIQKQILI